MLALSLVVARRVLESRGEKEERAGRVWVGLIFADPQAPSLNGVRNVSNEWPNLYRQGGYDQVLDCGYVQRWARWGVT